MSDFDNYLLYRALHRKFSRPSGSALSFKDEMLFAKAEHEADHQQLFDDISEALDPDKAKNICFKESEEFAERLNYVCDSLDVQKREFLRRAVLDAILRAEDRINELLENEK